MKFNLPLVLFVAAALPVAAEVEIDPPASATETEGLEAWSRIYEVASHPRCANCHTGASDRPMWSGPSYGQTRPHGMNIRAGESRIGAEHLLCSTCHTSKDEDWDDANTMPHAAPSLRTKTKLKNPSITTRCSPSWKWVRIHSLLHRSRTNRGKPTDQANNNSRMRTGTNSPA